MPAPVNRPVADTRSVAAGRGGANVEIPEAGGAGPVLSNRLTVLADEARSAARA